VSSVVSIEPPSDRLGDYIQRRLVLECVAAGRPIATDGLMLAIHGRDASPRQIVSLASVLGDFRIIAPRSARWSGHTAFGCFDWFASPEPPVVEPIAFGDGLHQLELLLLEQTRAVAGGSPRCTLVGYDQGACMALTLAALWPERVQAVISIAGYWPQVNDWEIPNREMRLSALLIQNSVNDDRGSPCGASAADELRRRGAHVTEVRDTPCFANPDWDRLAPIAREWLVRIATSDRQEVSACTSFA
jgi:pimeloyl-ACP methyl ester carboxylesterase